MQIQLSLALLMLVGLASAQFPGFGFCPDKRAMAGFDIEKFMGTWYEAERYFTVVEAGSRCARTNYTKASDGRILVTNEITNRLTGIKRVLDGEMRNVPKGGADSKISVKYSSLPFPVQTEYSILDTDYDSYAVAWNCAGYGLVNTQSAWIMTRERLPPGTVLQKAYATLDKHKISRTFFVRAEQEECNLSEPLGPPLKSRNAVADPEERPEALPVPVAETQAKPEPAPALVASKPELAPAVVPEPVAAAPATVPEIKKPSPAVTAAPPLASPVTTEQKKN